MTLSSQTVQPVWPILARSSVALFAVALPLGAVLLLAEASALPAIIALAMMSAGMIAAAASGRLWLGLGAAVGVAFTLLLVASVSGQSIGIEPFGVALAAAIASLSFAARGALFARSAGPRGWLVALAIVAGEGAVVLSAVIDPDLWPDWLLALLPAQWASMAFDAAIGSTFGTAPLTALGGTALATLLVVHLWPRRWTYAIMFSVWLGLSALVYHSAV